MDHPKYPRISHFFRYKGNPKRFKDQKCPCGLQAVGRVEIQVSWFRGDDEIELRCEEHKDQPKVKKP